MTGCPLLDSEYAARQNGKRLPCERLADENERLRELVRDIADHIKHDDGFGIDRGWVLDRMRELGVDA